MRKLRRDLRVVLAGVCCGLFGVSVFLLAERVNSYYVYLGELNYSETYHRGVEDLWWIPLVLGHVVVSVVAALLVHRYASDSVSRFLLWQAIGLVALGGWGLMLFVALGTECLIRGSIHPIAQMWDRVDTLFGIARFIAAIFASNVLYGSAIQAATSTDYTDDSKQSA